MLPLRHIEYLVERSKFVNSTLNMGTILILIEEVRKYTCLLEEHQQRFITKTRQSNKENEWTSVADAPRARNSNSRALFASAQKTFDAETNGTEEVTDVK